MSKKDFNCQVWQALKLIPRGKVTTYKEIARFIGNPRAYRAVGQACHKNTDAPEIPCHRVVKSDGQLGGYARGVKKKIGLLRKEGIIIVSKKVQELKSKIFEFK